MTVADLEAALRLIATTAPDLRKAGVTMVAIGDLEFELAPPEPAAVAMAPTPTPEKPYDPLRDPDTFGGRLPRRRGEPPSDEDAMSDER